MHTAHCTSIRMSYNSGRERPDIRKLACRGQFWGRHGRSYSRDWPCEGHYQKSAKKITITYLPLASLMCPPLRLSDRRSVQNAFSRLLRGACYGQYWHWYLISLSGLDPLGEYLTRPHNCELSGRSNDTKETTWNSSKNQLLYQPITNQRTDTKSV